MRLAEALITIQTMADHSQKWNDKTKSRNIKSNSSKDGLAALVGCQICEGPHLDKDCPLNEEVKQVEEVRYGEFGRTMPFNENNGGKFQAKLRRTKHEEESARRSTKMKGWIKKIQENAKVNIRNQNALPKNLETQIEQLTEELHSRKEKSKQAKVEDFIWNKRYSEWCNENSHGKKPRPGDYTFKEWVKIKKGHIDISKSVRKDLFRLWVIDQFTKALDPDKDPLERCLDEYNWNKDWWYDYRYEDEEKMELGNEDYNPPMVHTETFEVTKCKFNNGCSFICVSGKNNETLSLGRKNGSRFRKMIMEEMEEVLGDDEVDSGDKT
ncbi:hypothetical protein Tco_0930351 [Tanacetum coccineum]